MTTLYFLLALAAGATLAVQIGVNHSLRVGIGSPTVAALISFLIGTLFLLGYALVERAAWPSLQTLARLPPWTLLGGVLGAFYVTSVIIAAPRLGAAAVVSSLIAAQLVTSLVLDHYGWVGFTQHSINGWRVLGALLLFGGTLLILRN